MTDAPAIDAALGWLRRGDAARSLRELQQLIAASPHDASLHNALGSVLAATGQYEAAAASFEEALRLQPAYPAARVNLGQARLEAGELPEALASFETALRTPGAPVQAELGLARVACCSAASATPTPHSRARSPGPMRSPARRRSAATPRCSIPRWMRSA